MPYAGVNGQRLYYEVGGDGEPLLLIHGAFASADFLEGPATGLASGFRVVRYDRRGHGRSSPCERAVSLAEETADLLALMDWFGIPQAHVLAHDEGAEISIELVLAAPGRVLALGLLAPTMEGLAPDANTLQARATLSAALEADPAKAVQGVLLPQRIFDAAREREGIEERLKGLFLASAPSSARFRRAPRASGLPHASRISQIAVRTGIFVGDHDDPDRLRCAETLADGIPGAALIAFPGLSRFLHIEDPRAVMRRLTDFFLPEPDAR